MPQQISVLVHLSHCDSSVMVFFAFFLFVASVCQPSLQPVPSTKWQKQQHCWTFFFFFLLILNWLYYGTKAILLCMGLVWCGRECCPLLPEQRYLSFCMIFLYLGDFVASWIMSQCKTLNKSTSIFGIQYSAVFCILMLLLECTMY